ncbi:MAG TPA: winged helix-turn-helix domain-containing protein, partial [Pyrinomonadaceae bacterium]|nr:winged helix-turn-helix domain-containing protein [Pyrinomonadaceae bacterium]
MATSVKHAFEFGPFRLEVERHRLLRHNEVIILPPRAIDALLVLVQRPWMMVKREELMGAVWPDSFVEDSNLTVAVSQLRKALAENGNGAAYIETVPRGGYRFVADVREVDEQPGSLIVEKHTLSETVIEEEFLHEQSQSKIQSTAVVAPVTGWRASINRHKIAILATIILLLGTFVGGFKYFNRAESLLLAPENRAGLPIRSITVLPLKPITTSDSDKALSLGLADSLITRLGSSQSIVVRPVSSITQYADDEYDALAVGRKLQTDAVLEGSFQRADNHLRVSLKLLLVADGKQIWSNTFDVSESDIFRLQDRIATEAASALVLNLNQQQRDRVLKQYTDNLEAYRAYLRGRYFFHSRDKNIANLDKAISEFEQALRLDANYVLAYSGLADAYARKAAAASGEKHKELYDKAKTFAQQALLLDDNLAEAHAAIGWINRVYDWDWTGSEKHLKRAIELAPNEADHYRLYALLLITTGRTKEALEPARKARDLYAVERNNPFAFALLCDRQFSESIREYSRTLEVSPDSADSRHGLALAYLKSGMYREVIQTVHQSPREQQDGYSMGAMLQIAYFHLGEKDRAQILLKELEQRARESGDPHV